MAEMVKTILTCPSCKSQLQLEARLSFASGPKASQEKSSSPAVNVEEISELLTLAQGRKMTETELRFVDDVSQRLDKYGETIILSEKQMAWLRRIASGETQR